ncbi:MAG: arylsulfatase, partial [Bacteroides sp.]|nr:arylsulfatase [Bacteroides sp.]
DDTDRPWVVESSAGLSIRTKEWKYIDPNDGEAMISWGPKVETGNLSTPQLYNMENLAEKENVATQYPEKVFEMQKILRRVKNQTMKME